MEGASIWGAFFIVCQSVDQGETKDDEQDCRKTVSIDTHGGILYTLASNFSSI
jgi:hypothetical protein